MPRNLMNFAFLIIIIELNAYHHEGDYWAILDKSILAYYNPAYCTNVTYKVTFYNRTQKAIYFNITLTQDVSKKTEFKVQAYKLLSNEYRFFPITLSLNLCAEIEKNTFGVRTLLEKSSNIRECPMKKGSYYMRNGIIDFSAFPPLIPPGMYKIQEKYLSDADLVLEIHTFYTVTEFVKKWEN